MTSSCEQTGWSILSILHPLGTATPELAVPRCKSLYLSGSLTLVDAWWWWVGQNKVAKQFCCEWLSLTMRNGPPYLGYGDYCIIQPRSSYFSAPLQIQIAHAQWAGKLAFLHQHLLLLLATVFKRNTHSYRTYTITESQSLGSRNPSPKARAWDASSPSKIGFRSANFF